LATVSYNYFDSLARCSRAGLFMRSHRVALTKLRGSAHHIQLLFCQQVKQLCFLLFSTTYELQISQVLCFEIDTKCPGVYVPPCTSEGSCLRLLSSVRSRMYPLFSSSCALFHFAYPVSPLLATLTKRWGGGGIIPISVHLSNRGSMLFPFIRRTRARDTDCDSRITGHCQIRCPIFHGN
jgi:hypothetical protein